MAAVAFATTPVCSWSGNMDPFFFPPNVNCPTVPRLSWTYLIGCVKVSYVIRLEMFYNPGFILSFSLIIKAKCGDSSVEEWG